MNNLIKYLFPFIDGVEEVGTKTPEGLYLNPYSFDKRMGNKFQILAVNKKLTHSDKRLIARRGARLIEEFQLKNDTGDDRSYTSYVYELGNAPSKKKQP